MSNTRKVETRDVIDKNILGKSISFISSNNRIKERVNNISHEEYVIRKLIERSQYDDVFWDVGACLGIHTFILSNFLTDGQVISFEPMPSNRGILVDNRNINEARNVTICRSALSNKNEEREFAIRESVKAGFGRHSFKTSDESYDNIKTISVQSKKGSNINYPKPNIIKVDAEGAGPLVIEGLKPMISSDECHTIVFETHRPNSVQPSHKDFGYTESDFIELVEDCGFKVRQLEKDYHYIGKKSIDQFGKLDTKVESDIIQSDISEVQTDGIINSAGTSLRMGSGVAGSLREKGGEELNESAILKGPVNIGESVRTCGFDLKCNYVYHAASMPHYGDGKSTPKSIRSSLESSLKLAESDEIESISIPMIGCGIGGVPITTGSRVIRDIINDFDFKSIKKVVIVGYKDEELNIIRKIFN
jgi:FkbM family methyltransferase